jgi:hypothetical protein
VYQVLRQEFLRGVTLKKDGANGEQLVCVGRKRRTRWKRQRNDVCLKEIIYWAGLSGW